MPIQVAINKLKNQLPPDCWTEDQDSIAPHLKEWRDRWQGKTPFLVRPKSTDEVIRTVNICRETQAQLCLQGGNTGLVGGQIPQGEILLTTQQLNAIRQQSSETITAEAGVTLSTIHATASLNHKKFPLSLASEGTATVGGLCSTNAGGMHVVRYGSMRELVSGVEVVTADGQLINTLKTLKKDNTGYDLKSIFIGSEGTLGIITAATLKLSPRPLRTETFFLAIESPKHATELYLSLKENFSEQLSVIELIPSHAIDWVTECFDDTRKPFNKDYAWFLLIEFDIHQHHNPDLETAIQTNINKGLIHDAVFAQSNKQAQQLKFLRESISAAQKFIGSSIKHDISVPINAIDTFISTASKAAKKLIPDCRPLPFGHIGDGNIHFNVMQPAAMDSETFLSCWQEMNQIVHDIVIDLGGSISAEHGIGILKKQELSERYPEKVHQMRRIKHAFDPANIFNPRVLLP